MQRMQGKGCTNRGYEKLMISEYSKNLGITETMIDELDEFAKKVGYFVAMKGVVLFNEKMPDVEMEKTLEFMDENINLLKEDFLKMMEKEAGRAPYQMTF